MRRRCCIYALRSYYSRKGMLKNLSSQDILTGQTGDNFMQPFAVYLRKTFTFIVT